MVLGVFLSSLTNHGFPSVYNLFFVPTTAHAIQTLKLGLSLEEDQLFVNCWWVYFLAQLFVRQHNILTK